jgi:hypothetical protein
MAVKNLQSVVCNVATQCGNVTNLDSKGYGVATVQTPAMSSPQFPMLSMPAKPGLRRERDIYCATYQAATRSGSSLPYWAGATGYRGTEPLARSWAEGNQRFPGHIRNLANFAADDSADRDDGAVTIHLESLAGSPKA